jgi:hypothetical protein
MFFANSTYPVVKPFFTAKAGEGMPCRAAQEHVRRHSQNQALPNRQNERKHLSAKDFPPSLINFMGGGVNRYKSLVYKSVFHFISARESFLFACNTSILYVISHPLRNAPKSLFIIMKSSHGTSRSTRGVPENPGSLPDDSRLIHYESSQYVRLYFFKIL